MASKPLSLNLRHTDQALVSEGDRGERGREGRRKREGRREGGIEEREEEREGGKGKEGGREDKGGRKEKGGRETTCYTCFTCYSLSPFDKFLITSACSRPLPLVCSTTDDGKLFNSLCKIDPNLSAFSIKFSSIIT